MVRVGRCCLAAVALALIMAAAVCLATDCDAAEPPPQWPTIVAAADWAGVPPAELWALLWHESRLRSGLVNPRTGAEGLGAVVHDHWATLLDGAGLDRADLHDDRAGVWAVAEILRYLGRRWPGPRWRTLCLYGAGTKALRYKTHCAYSRTVERLARRARGWK